MTQDELIIKRFCKEYNVKLEKIDSYNWTQPGYVLNSDGRIEVLNLHDLEIKKIPEHISELSELKILHLVANELTSIKEIGGLTKLENLVIQANKIKNISVVEQFKNLRNFYANFNPIVDVTPLKHLENLEHLEIDTEKVNDLRQICYIPKLVNISLNVEGTTDITFLQDCKLQVFYGYNILICFHLKLSDVATTEARFYFIVVDDSGLLFQSSNSGTFLQLFFF